jgi:hypothetical protein
MRSEVSRVFVSYDRAHDGDLRDRLLSDAHRSSLFSIEACSEPCASGDFDAHMRERITVVDVVIVICGEHTDECPSVSEELRITREEGKPHLLLWGRRDSMCKKPAGSRADESIYGWSPDILRAQLQLFARAKREVPERLRRSPPAPKPEG